MTRRNLPKTRHTINPGPDCLNATQMLPQPAHQLHLTHRQDGFEKSGLRAPRKIPAVFPDRIESGSATCDWGNQPWPEGFFRTSRSGMPGWTRRTTRWRGSTRWFRGKTSGRVSRRHGASRPRNGSRRQGVSLGRGGDVQGDRSLASFTISRTTKWSTSFATASRSCGSWG